MNQTLFEALIIDVAGFFSQVLVLKVLEVLVKTVFCPKKHFQHFS
jgi:hypothetical protein